MLKNYFKLAYRNLLRNKTASVINLTGLSIAVACSIVVFLFLQNYWTLDNFHENGDRIYIVEHVIEDNGVEQTWGLAPAPLGPAMKAAFPQVERAVRMDLQGAFVQKGEAVFEELVYFVEDDFFEMFTFPLAQGVASVLQDPGAIVISHRIAEKLFADEDPMDQTLILSFDNQVRVPYVIRGVTAPPPENDGIRFDLLVGLEGRPAAFSDLEDWANLIRGTFIQVTQPEDITVIAEGMKPFKDAYNAKITDRVIKSFAFDNLLHPADGAHNVMRRPAEAPHPGPTIIFSMIVLMMMALACFNYVNIALGTTARRLKEIGVRKVMGGNRQQLIIQFMAENVLLCFLALLLGIVLAAAFLVPLFNAIMVLKVSIAWSENLALWFFLIGLLLFTAVASGAYPAFYVASFQPASVFRGSMAGTGKQRFTRAFLTIQFVLAFLAVIVSVVLVSTSEKWVGQDWGYNPDQTLVIRLRQADQYNLMRDAASQMAQITHVAGARHHIGEAFDRAEIGYTDTETVFRLDVGDGYMEALGLRLREGRFFDKDFAGDETAVIVNQTLVAEQGWETPIGSSIRVDSVDYTVVGVLEDFKFYTGSFLIDEPVLLTRAASETFGYLTVRFNTRAEDQTVAALKETWVSLFPDYPFEYFRQTSVFDGFYSSFNNVTNSFSYIALLALLIACMGIYGLASQRFMARQKEVGVRKVLGASSVNIALLVNQSFIKMLLIAGVIATVIGYGSLMMLVQAFEVRAIPVGPFPFILANLMVVVTATLAVASQLYRLVRVNPAAVLRNE